MAVCNGTARTSKYITELALLKGYKVKALVRSTGRFYTQTKRHDDLCVYELPDYNDIGTLAEILQDVSILFVALGHIGSGPIHLNEDCVQSACAALRRNLSKGTQSATKMVLLGSTACNPYVERTMSSFESWILDMLLGNLYSDLRRAQSYLQKQKSWLQYAVVTPGAMVDVEDAAAYKGEVRLVHADPGKQWQELISYRRLAAAMLEVGEDSGTQYNHQYITPLPTSKVCTSSRDFETRRAVFKNLVANKMLPYVFRATIFASIFAGLGYVARIKGIPF